MVIGYGSNKIALSESKARSIMAKALATLPVDGKKVLILIPDRTRTAPMPLFFKLFTSCWATASPSSTIWWRWAPTRRWTRRA